MAFVWKAALAAASLACASNASAATVVYSGPCDQFCYFGKVNGTVNSVALSYSYRAFQSFLVDPLQPPPTYRITGNVIVSGGSPVAYDFTQTAPGGTFFFDVPVDQVIMTGLAYFQGAGLFEAGAFTIPNYTQVSGATIGAQTGGRAFSSAIRITIDYTPVVPEPSTWALMLAGFGMVGYALRRRPKLSYAL